MSNHDTEEMTMEEILASIRRYVSDETPELSQSGLDYSSGHTAEVIRLTDAIDQGKSQMKADFIPNAKLDPLPEMPSHPVQHQQHYQDQRIQPEVRSYHDVKPSVDPYQHNQPAYVQPIIHHPKASATVSHSVPPVMQQASSPKVDTVSTPIQDMPSIISEQALNSTTNAFSKLSDVFLSVKTERDQQAAAQKGQGVSAIESFVIEMARPMIRQWIDQHLPPLVEKLVTQEINKLIEDLRRKTF